MSEASRDTSLNGEALEHRSLKRKSSDVAETPGSKRAAKRKRKRPADAGNDVDGSSLGNPAIAEMDGSLMADYIDRQMRRFEKDSSALELEDCRISGAAFADTSGWTGPRTLESLPGFLEHVSGKSRKALAKTATNVKGSPHTIVVTASGLRAADITRALRVYQTASAVVAKLFAKHIKLKDAILSTKNTTMNFGVGTPQRLLDLVENEALSMDRVERVVVDASHTDLKQRGVLDMRETLAPLTRFLTLQSTAKGSRKIVIF